MDTKQRIILLTIIAGALALRIMFSAAVVGVATAPRGDEADYLSIASNVAAGDGFRTAEGYVTARRPPLYPLFLALWFRAAGASIVPGRILQWFLGAAIVYLVFLLGRTVLGIRTALAAALAVALNPFLIFISGYLLTENLYIVLLLTLLIVAAGPMRRRSCRCKEAILAGIFLGAASLCRPTAVLLLLFIAFAIIFLTRDRMAVRLRNTALFFIMFFVIVSPWAWRNHRAFGAWVPFTTHGGITFYQSNNPVVMKYPQYRGSVAPLYALPGYDRLKTLDEMEKDRESWRLGKQFLKENPRLVPALIVGKFKRFWRFRSDVGMSGIRSGWWWDTRRFPGNLASRFDAGLIYAAVVMPLFIAGLFMTIRLRRRLFLWYGVIIVHTMLALVFFGSLRARLPLEPFIALIAAAGLMALLRRPDRAVDRHP